MAYSFDHNHPDPLVLCDIPNCQADSDDVLDQPQGQAINRLNFGHTIHRCCLPTTSRGHCPLCVVSFTDRVKELSNTFNRYLLGQDNQDNSEHPDDDNADLIDNEDENDEVELDDEDQEKTQTVRAES